MHALLYAALVATIAARARAWLLPLQLRTTHTTACRAATPSLPERECKTALVTGASRGLGLALATLLVQQDYHVILTARSEADGRKAASDLSAQCQGTGTITFWHLDVSSPDSIKHFATQCVPTLPSGSLTAVFNNAGVCLSGADIATLQHSLDVNFYGPLCVMEACLPFMDEEGVVVNVSSGDGELLWLNSDIAEALRQAQTVQDVRAAADRILQRAALDPGAELAFGATPAYSVSKALLNAAVRCHHGIPYAPDPAEDALNAGRASSCGGGSTAQRPAVVAVCPGDVRTRMASTEEAQREGVLSALEAAAHVVGLAMRRERTAGGLFYRYGAVIPW
eukprot:TRINITY_DN287_c0_g1_i1.p1 TRINITY_DN287_c0_g1~~TRINITY_DN287_c0_g1_i1.p1  ORF type:complete len:338 (+),score=62.80 TRINITY_DN287_c0_g1_i1:39-1052(+)